MKPIHLLASLFAILMAALDLALVRRFQPPSDTVLMVYLGLVFGQLALLSLWLVWAQGPWIVRFSLTLIATMIVSQPLGTVTGLTGAEWSTCNGLLVGLMTATLLVARRSKVCRDFVDHLDIAVGRAPSASDDPRPVILPRTWRFALSGLFSIVTAAAIGLGMVQQLRIAYEHAWGLTAYGLGLGMVATCTFWAFLSRSPEPRRWLIMLSTCLTSGWALSRVAPSHSMPFHTVVLLVEALVISAGINIIRISSTCVDAARSPAAADERSNCPVASATATTRVY